MNQTLVRLVNDNNINDGKKGIFKAIFNDGILVGKDAQIALQSIVLNRGHEEFTINSTNDILKFSLGAVDATQKEIRLNHRTYNKLTFFELLIDIEDKLNLALSSNENRHEANRQISVSLNDDDKVFIQVRGLPSPDVVAGIPDSLILFDNNSVEYFAYEDAFGVERNTLVLDTLNPLKSPPERIQRLTRTSGVGDNLTTDTTRITGYCFGNRPIGSGGSIFRARISKLEANTNG